MKCFYYGRGLETEHFGRVVNILASYSGCPVFKYLSKDRPPWLWFNRGFSSTGTQTYIKKQRFLFLFINNRKLGIIP
jgi:hypothetical protein